MFFSSHAGHYGMQRGKFGPGAPLQSGDFRRSGRLLDGGPALRAGVSAPSRRRACRRAGVPGSLALQRQCPVVVSPAPLGDDPESRRSCRELTGLVKRGQTAFSQGAFLNSRVCVLEKGICPPFTHALGLGQAARKVGRIVSYAAF